MQQDNDVCGFPLNLICKENILCKNKSCELKHPRRFAGLCIESLENLECPNEKACKKVHFETFNFQRKGLEKKQINGYCCFNICREDDCKNNQNCGYLHPEWNFKYCKKCINDEKCKEKHSKEIAVEWDKVSEMAYSQYNVGDENPENICSKAECTCVKNHNAKLLKSRFCILYFQGNCPNIKCSKIHMTWESYKLNPESCKLNTDLYPCTQTQQQQFEKQKELSQKNLEITTMFNLKKLIKGNNIIDVVFIIDCTGSMQTWIDKCKDQIEKAATSFMQSAKEIYKIRLSFVGYRDYCDKGEQIISLDLTENLNEFTKLLSQVKAKGGGDTAEDLFSGLEEALKFKFNDSPKSILITFLFADAPCHGRQYHDGVSDNHADQIENGRLEKIMFRYNGIKENNYFFCIELNKSTEKMFSIMKEQMRNFQLKNQLDAEDVNNLFQQTLKLSIQKSILSDEYMEFKAKITSPLQISLEQYQACKTIETFWGDFKQNVTCSQYDAMLSISFKPLTLKQNEQGQISVVFMIYDLTNSVRYIMKIKNNVYDELRQLKQLKQYTQISDKCVNEHKDDVDLRFINQTKAQLLAKIYREKTRNIVGAPPIYFAQPLIIELEQPYYGLQTFYAETFIKLPNIEWKKYSNNGVFQDESHYYISSFSHFTYEESGKQFVLTDLQGKENILSDPAFHHKEIPTQKSSTHLQLGQNTQYSNTEPFQTNQSSRMNTSETDCRLTGLAYFEQKQHQVCSFICEKLRYQSFTQKQDMKLHDSEWQRIYQKCKSCDKLKQVLKSQQGEDKYCDDCLKKVEKIYQICKSCGKIKQILKSQQGKDKYCDDCLKKVEKIYQICETCGNLKQILKSQYEQGKDTDCDHCLEYSKLLSKSICNCCQKIVDIKLVYNLLRHTDSQFCNECKINCKLKKNICQYCGTSCNAQVQSFADSFICKKGLRYLKSLICEQCSKKNEKETVSRDYFIKGIYVCQTCREKKIN